MISAESLWQDMLAIRTQAPLVVNVTNNVVTAATANALLAAGASPAMSHAAADASELAAVAGALVLNMGTPAPPYVDSMEQAAASATRHGKPVVFDPVACGATAHRREVARRVLEAGRMTVVRSNASEMLSLAGEDALSKGVDSAHDSVLAVDAARIVATRLNCVTCVSGALDVVTDGERAALLRGGHPMMTRVTGMGCTATAIVGAFLAVNADAMTATLHAMAVMSHCGAKAASMATGPGSLWVGFLDALYAFEREDAELAARQYEALE